MSDRVDEVLGALADRTRRTIVSELAGGATPTATELARELPMSRQAIVKHLRVLSDAGLVSGERRGRETRYHLCEDGLEVATEWLDTVATMWEDRLRRLKAAAERDATS